MGQKTNPNILQLNKTNDWNSQYIEKTSKDFYLHAHKNLETKKFITNFFKKNGLLVQNCKLNYSNNTLSLLIQYHQNYNTLNNIIEINKKQKINFKKNVFNFDNFRKHFKILKSIKNYFNYKNLIYKRDFVKKNLEIKKILKIKRLKALSLYKKYLNIKFHKNIKNSLNKDFVKTLTNNLFKFYNTINNITLILKPLNVNIHKSIKNTKFIKLKKKLIKLRKYQRNDFFKEGLSIAFSATSNKNSSEMLANYIALSLKKLKRHNFFLRFLKTLLNIFISKNLFNIIKGIKIKVKGRINGAPRAKNKIITIGKAMPLFTIDSLINYSEATSYTSNGTLGVKVWVCEKNK